MLDYVTTLKRHGPINLKYNLTLKSARRGGKIRHTIRLETIEWPKDIPSHFAFYGTAGIVEVWSGKAPPSIRFRMLPVTPIIALNTNVDSAYYSECISKTAIDEKLNTPKEVKLINTLLKNHFILIGKLLEEFTGKTKFLSPPVCDYKINFR